MVNGNGKGAAQSTTAGNLYHLVLEAKPTFSPRWFSITDTATRLWLAIYAFYRFLGTQPLSLLRFAYGWNTLWCAACRLRTAPPGPARGRVAQLWAPAPRDPGR